MSGFKAIDVYIHISPAKVQTILNELRQTIQEVAPEAEEESKGETE